MIIRFDEFEKQQFLVSFRQDKSIHLTHFSPHSNFLAPENLKKKRYTLAQNGIVYCYYYNMHYTRLQFYILFIAIYIYIYMYICIYIYIYLFIIIIILFKDLKIFCSRVISCYYFRKMGESSMWGRKSQTGCRNKLKWLVNFCQICSLPYPPCQILSYIVDEMCNMSKGILFSKESCFRSC